MKGTAGQKEYSRNTDKVETPARASARNRHPCAEDDRRERKKKMTKLYKCTNKEAYRMIKAESPIAIWDQTKDGPLTLTVDKAVIFDMHSQNYGDSVVVRIQSGEKVYQARNRTADECDKIFALVGADDVVIKFRRLVSKNGREYLAVDIVED